MKEKISGEGKIRTAHRLDLKRDDDALDCLAASDVN